MRTEAGFLAFNALALGLGLGLLSSAGLVRPRLASALPAAGAALATGLAAIGVVSVAAVVAGLNLDAAALTAVVVVAAAVSGAVGLLRSRRAAGLGPRWRRPAPATWVPVAVIGAFTAAQVILSR